MTKARSNAVAEAAKGDLSVGSGTNLAGILAVGNNGETLVADSSTSTGLRYNPSQAAGKNIAINGGMDIWQRGTSRAFGTVGGFGADRYIIVRSGWAGGATMSRQAGTTDIQYCARVQRDSGNTSTAYIATTCSLETANSIPFAGKTITFSFYARKGANFSEASSYLSYSLSSGTGTDQNLTNTGFTNQTAIFDSVVTLTTSWQRFTFTGTVSSSATQLGFGFSYTPTGTAGANDYFEVTGIQIELGSVATEFTRTGGTIQGELAACQRYYYRWTPNAVYQDAGTGYNPTSAVASIITPFPVPMRVAPSALEQSGTASNYQVLHSSGGAAARTTCNAVPFFQSANVNNTRTYFPVSSGLTAGQGSIGGNDNNTTGYLGWSAEL